MNQREAKRKVCSAVWRLLDMNTNEFLHEDDKGLPLSIADAQRMAKAMDELCQELYERGQPRDKPWR